jgi:hypothetical protein
MELGQLITQLMIYISAVSGSFSEELKYNAQLDAPTYTPEVRFVSAEQLYSLHFGRTQGSGISFEVGAVYQPGGIIYLRDDWDIASIDDQGLLLHELVHFMQDTNFFLYECEGDQERLAYYIQEKWLQEKHNRTLYESLDLNPLALIFAMM